MGHAQTSWESDTEADSHNVEVNNSVATLPDVDDTVWQYYQMCARQYGSIPRLRHRRQCGNITRHDNSMAVSSNVDNSMVALPDEYVS